MDLGPPLLSVGPLLNGSTDVETAMAMHQACVSSGFFVAVDHGLEDKIDDVFGVAAAFFAQSAERKHQIPRHGQYGYVPHRSQAIEPSTRGSDHVEYLDLGLADESPLPQLPEFESTVRDYQKSALAVAADLLAALTVGLGIDKDFFANTMSQPECKLRLLHYPYGSGSSGGSPPVTMPAHTDYGALTLLATDGVAGLEIKPIDADWTPITAPPRSLVVNLGDMLARWTNDRYRSTPHRVVGTAGVDRYTVPFFINPNPDTIIDCISSCVTVDKPCCYEPVSASEFLDLRRSGGAEPYIKSDR